MSLLLSLFLDHIPEHVKTLHQKHKELIQERVSLKSEEALVLLDEKEKAILEEIKHELSSKIPLFNLMGASVEIEALVKQSILFRTMEAMENVRVKLLAEMDAQAKQMSK